MFEKMSSWLAERFSTWELVIILLFLLVIMTNIGLAVLASISGS
jgi:hypothetical protein